LPRLFSDSAVILGNTDLGRSLTYAVGSGGIHHFTNGGISIDSTNPDGSALKIPNGSWIRPQTVGGDFFLTNGVDHNTRSRVHLVDSGFLAWGADATDTFGQFRMEDGIATLIHYKANVANSRLDLNDDSVNLQSLGAVNSSVALGNTSASLFCGVTFGFIATPSGLQLGGIPSGTPTSNGFLGLDASGYIVKSTVSGGGAPSSFVQTANKTIVNTTTETSLLGPGVNSATVSANSLAVGTHFKLRGLGFIKNTGSPFIQVKVKIGSVVVMDTTLSGIYTITGSQQFTLECDFTVRAIGSGTSANVIGQGVFYYATNASTQPQVLFTTNTAVSSGFDSTTSNLIDTTFQWNTASASNEITCTNFTIERLN